MFTNYTEELNSKFVEEIQNLNQFRTLDYYYIIEAYGRVMSGYSDYFDAWIYNTDESWCVGFWISGNYLLNSKNLSNTDLLLINERINFSIFNQDGFHVAGNTELINSLSELNQSFSLEKFKERYFYVANKINFESEFVDKISLVLKDDIEEVAKLYQQYYVEEYNGANNKEIEEVKINIKSLITRNLIYKLEIEDEIIGFCTKMSFLSEYPNMIGTIFIKESHRNKKYAQHLLSKISNDMLTLNQEIYLMTTKENLASNKMVENIGFSKKYEHSDRIIRNYA
jgi:RimJ/RimL family protein N-acetyltransferase